MSAPEDQPDPSDPAWQYMQAHPDAPPEELCAFLGVPFDRALWNEMLSDHPDLLRSLSNSPNPNDRKNWSIKRDD